MGVTMICSSVPRSRSRTTAKAVSNKVWNNRISPMTPGTMKFTLSMLGL